MLDDTPLLAGRTVMIMVARLDDRTLRVNVIPTKKSEDDNAALTTPLSYTGTPEELDRELGKLVITGERAPGSSAGGPKGPPSERA